MIANNENIQGNSINFFIGILDHIEKPIFIKDEAHQWVFINKTWCALMGHSRDHLLGKTDYDFHPKKEADVFWEKDQIVLETGIPNTNVELATWVDGTHQISTRKTRFIDPITNQKYVVGIITDITNEIEIKNKLLRSETNLDEILKYSCDISYKIDLATVSYEYLSYSIEEILGWTRKLYMDQGRDFTKTIIHPDDIDRMEAIIPSIHEIVDDKLNLNEIEFRLRHKNGSYRWFLDRFTYIKDDNNNPRFIIGTMVDITERKLTEFALIESEDKFRNLIDQAPFDIQIYDLNGFLQKVNRNYQTYWDIDPKDVIRKYNVLQDPQLKGTEIFSAIRQAFQGNFSDPIENFYDPNKSGYTGKPIWLRTTVFPLKNDQNQISSIIIIHQDISEQKQNLIKLQESEEKYNQLFQKSRDAIILHKISGEIIEVNQSAQDLFGYSREELLNIVINDLHPTDKKSLNGTITQDILKGSQTSFEILMQRKDGAHFESRIRSSIIKISEDMYIQSIIQNISELKRRDAERLRTQKIESIALLAGGIAHDFNNILVGILGNANLMQMDDTLDSETLDSLKDIEKATLRASELTKQLLTFSKGGAPLKKSQDITAIFRESISFVMRGSKSKCIIDAEKNLPAVEVDSGQMSQVFNNLLINANQAMKTGGEIYISLKVINFLNSLDIPLPNGHYIRICIKDQGGGIPKGIQQHIFEPYFTTKEKGNGLGLATCYSIIKRHGGYITFETTINVGTTFIIFLPINEKALNMQYKNLSEKKSSKNEFSGKVIIMDDDPMILKTLSKILGKFGLNVDLAHDGHKLIDLYQSALNSNDKYDLVIMDLTIPGGFGGKETIARLKKVDPNIKAIVSSGYSNDLIIAHYKEFGFSQVLNKPYTIKAIKQILLEFL